MIENTPKIDRIGVSKVESFFSEQGWLFREQTIHDYGIDAQVEIVLNDKPTGALIGIQIKSGDSYFNESNETEYIFRTDDKHIDYWTKHCLPIIIVFYNPTTNLLYWQSVSDDTLIKTSKMWKIKIPKNKYLNNSSIKNLCELTQPAPYIQKLNKLRLDKDWIDLIADGELVYIEFEDWVNKSLSRSEFRLVCDSRNDIEPEEWFFMWVGIPIDAALRSIIPWADFLADEEAYREYMEPVWFTDHYHGYDNEEGCNIMSTDFEEWYRPPKINEIVPVCGDRGEVEGYKLYLSLNDVGKAFLTINNYLEKNNDVEFR